MLEKSLSVDNLFVFVLLFSTFGVPASYQHKVLFWGVVGKDLLYALIGLAISVLLPFAVTPVIQKEIVLWLK